MARRIVFHIGLAKTGTTSFQRFCKENRRRLAAHGVLYPKSQLGLAKNHSPLVASYIAHRPEGPTVALRWAPRERAVHALKAEIDASPCPVALISSEHFSTHFDRPEARQLAEDFAAYDPLIVITLRDTHGRFLSSYNTHVTAGGRMTMEPYARSMLVPNTRFMSAREAVSIWQEAFGADRIRIVDYDAESDVSAAILRESGMTNDLRGASVYRDRLSHGPAFVDALRCANQAIAERQAVPTERSMAAWAQSTLFSILCRRRLEKECVGTPPGRWIVSPKTMADLDAFALDDRRWVTETYGIRLKGSNARDRIDVRDGGPPPATEAEMARARALLSRVAGPLWATSQALVTVWQRTGGSAAQIKGRDGVR